MSGLKNVAKIGPAAFLAGALTVMAGASFAGQGKPNVPVPAPTPTTVPAKTAATPTVVPKLSDVASDEFKNYTVRLEGPVNLESATELNAKLRYLDAHNPQHKDITLIIQSGGGLVTAGFSIYDTLKSMHSDVRTVCEGFCASMAAFILTAGGTPGKREAQPNASLLYHQLSAGCEGKGTNIRICNDDIQKTKEQMLDIMMTYTGLPRDELAPMMERDWTITAQQAKQYGFIDKIVAPVQNTQPAITPHHIPQQVMEQHLRIN